MQSLCNEEAGTALLRFFIALLKEIISQVTGGRIWAGFRREAHGDVLTLGQGRNGEAVEMLCGGLYGKLLRTHVWVPAAPFN